MVEHEGRFEDDQDDSCPICRGEELDPDFLAMIEAAAAQPGWVMIGEEAIEWVQSL